VVLALVILGVIALLVGYAIGYKDAEKEEQHFLGNMLDYLKSGKRPD
jgi:hypothetical protein